jgi:hypothetical protein
VGESENCGFPSTTSASVARDSHFKFYANSRTAGIRLCLESVVGLDRGLVLELKSSFPWVFGL